LPHLLHFQAVIVASSLSRTEHQELSPLRSTDDRESHLKRGRK
jgi:hypothetical protein